MKNVQQERCRTWGMHSRLELDAGHEDLWKEAFRKLGIHETREAGFVYFGYLHRRKFMIYLQMSTFRFFFVDLDNKQFVSFHKKKKIHFFCERLYCSFDHTLHSFERFRFVSILNNFEIIDLFAWFNACLRKIIT